jgi:hypothetical protein
MAAKEDNLVKAAGSTTIYVVGESGELRPIPDSATLLSQWNWDQVRTLPDSDIDARPVGEPLPSIIQPPEYPNGTLLASPLEEQLYVTEDGGRWVIPDPHTFESHGFSREDIDYVAPELLNTIPIVGAVSLDAPPPINTGGSLYTFLGAGHQMWTGADLWRDSGYLRATTRTRTYTALGGFTGGAQVVLLGQGGTMIGSTGIHSFGVDGYWIGRNDRTDTWYERVDPSLAARAVSLGVVHAWTPKVPMYEMVRRGIEYAARFWAWLQENVFGREDRGGAQGPIFALP